MRWGAGVIQRYGTFLLFGHLFLTVMNDGKAIRQLTAHRCHSNRVAFQFIQAQAVNTTGQSSTNTGCRNRTQTHQRTNVEHVAMDMTPYLVLSPSMMAKSEMVWDSADESSSCDYVCERQINPIQSQKPKPHRTSCFFSVRCTLMRVEAMRFVGPFDCNAIIVP